MIVVDVSAAVHARAGLGRYAEQTALQVARVAEEPVSLFNNLGAGGRLPPSLVGLPRKQVQAGYKPWRMAVWLGQLGRVGFDRLLPPETTVFHATEHLLLPLRKVPTVLSIHDLIFKLFPEYHKTLNYRFLNAAVPLFCRRADAIIAVSEATKRDIVAHYGIASSKIHVVYEAAADHFRPNSAEKQAEVRRKYALPDQYLVHLSTIEPRKNLDRAVDALLLLQEKWPDLTLVLVGSKGWLYDSFFARIEREGLQNKVIALGWVDDDDLSAVLEAADLGLQPSLYEGFGLPILEQMASGQVVAASRASSHPEVGGDAAAYFDPLSVAEMANVIDRLLGDGDEYAHRRQLGIEQAAKFSWEKAARQTLAVYNSVR